MENVGIYTPPVADPVNAAVVSDTYSAELSNDDLEVTESAQQKLAEIVSQSEDDVAGIRIYVGGGGCGGMTYGMTFTDETSEFDTVLSFDSFKVLVDVVALNYLRGAQIDYIQEVGRERFVFNNVFAETGGSGTCGGCGSSGGGCS
ncbi:MAG: iron-sulfur cluster assembly accessory protein [Gammaproteobacteria bacterium]|nr:iron-sulfur cluster assembly accessory protein [Gammaproteobacteria bacterium]